MEYTIQEVAKAAGTSSRALRHYGELGLVQPSRTGSNGYRFYDDRALVRLQRVLLLRELGLGLEAIGRVLAAQDSEPGGAESSGAEPGGAESSGAEPAGRKRTSDGHESGATAEADQRSAEAQILTTHLGMLRRERDRVDRQIGAVERTIEALRSPTGRAGSVADPQTATHARNQGTQGETLMSANMFDGFDHTEHQEEVEERWGKAAYAESDRWWRSLSKTGKEDWMEHVKQLGADWTRAAENGVDPQSSTARALAERHIAWLRSVPGTPSGESFTGYVLGLGEMYVGDERFAANYGGIQGATFVRDTLRAYLGGEAE